MNICEKVFIEQDTNSMVASIAKKIEQVDSCDTLVAKDVLIVPIAALKNAA